MKHTVYSILSISTALLLGGCGPEAKLQGSSFTSQEVKSSDQQFSNKRRIATGFFVSNEGHFITNYHVIKDANQIMITTAGGQKVSAKVVLENRDIDIVVAKAEIKSQGVNWETRNRVNKGEGVLTLGYPLMVIQGPEQKATFGRINSFSGIHGDQAVYQIDVPVQPGNSGGPLISENGYVIGVIKATFNQMAALETIGTLTQNISYAVKSDQVIPMLRQVLGNQFKIGDQTKNKQDMPLLITKYERSVVLVEAE